MSSSSSSTLRKAFGNGAKTTASALSSKSPKELRAIRLFEYIEECEIKEKAARREWLEVRVEAQREAIRLKTEEWERKLSAMERRETLQREALMKAKHQRTSERRLREQTKLPKLTANRSASKPTTSTSKFVSFPKPSTRKSSSTPPGRGIESGKGSPEGLEPQSKPPTSPSRLDKSPLQNIDASADMLTPEGGELFAVAPHKKGAMLSGAVSRKTSSQNLLKQPSGILIKDGMTVDTLLKMFQEKYSVLPELSKMQPSNPLEVQKTRSLAETKRLYIRARGLREESRKNRSIYSTVKFGPNEMQECDADHSDSSRGDSPASLDASHENFQSEIDIPDMKAESQSLDVDENADMTLHRLVTSRQGYKYLDISGAELFPDEQETKSRSQSAKIVRIAVSRGSGDNKGSSSIDANLDVPSKSRLPSRPNLDFVEQQTQEKRSKTPEFWFTEKDPDVDLRYVKTKGGGRMQIGNHFVTNVLVMSRPTSRIAEEEGDVEENGKTKSKGNNKGKVDQNFSNASPRSPARTRTRTREIRSPQRTGLSTVPWTPPTAVFPPRSIKWAPITHSAAGELSSTKVPTKYLTAGMDVVELRTEPKQSKMTPIPAVLPQTSDNNGIIRFGNLAKGVRDYMPSQEDSNIITAKKWSSFKSVAPTRYWQNIVMYPSTC